MRTRFWSENLREGDHSEYLDIDGKCRSGRGIEEENTLFLP
jgi:hypothetical protein